MTEKLAKEMEDECIEALARNDNKAIMSVIKTPVVFVGQSVDRITWVGC